jgi:hypothetical protein
VQEAERLKNLVMVIKAAMSQAENDLHLGGGNREKETREKNADMDVEAPSKKQKTEPL